MSDCFIHVGYPKCASTALQTHFFSEHPQVFFLGPYLCNMAFDYYDDDVKALVEGHWRLMKDFGYNADFAKRTIDRCRSAFASSGKRLMGISSEGFSYTHHHDIDVTQKAQRLADALGRDTKVIMVIRNQFELIKSLYREMVSGGLASSFHKFTSDLFYNKFRSFLYDLDFLKMHELYSSHFGAERVLVLLYEELNSDPTRALERICEHLGLELSVTSLPRTNTTKTDSFYEHLRELNATYRNGMGLSIGEPLAQFRYEEYVRDIERAPLHPASNVEKSLWLTLRDRANELSEDNQNRTISYDMATYVERWMTDYYGSSNYVLADRLNLPLRQYDYQMKACGE